jgi:AAHS family 4-hydroxybenzoate transporter-like MFS transporter
MRTVPASLNVSRLIDERPVGRLQLLVFVCCAAVSLLDGMDTQSIGVAAPFIAQELGLKASEFGPIFSAALLGAALGAVGFGLMADRAGRKPLLLLALLMMAVFTSLTAYAPSRLWLLTLRFMAGVGLGGATPCFIALTSEYAPERSRGAWVTAMWTGFPLGIMLGAFTSALLIPHFGWRAIFYIGGIAPGLLMLVLAKVLPESLRFLTLRANRNAAARDILYRLGAPVPDRHTVLIADDDRLSGLPLRHVFTEGRAVGTLLLWVPFFSGFGILAVSLLWTPLLLRASGISPAATAFVVAFEGLGALIGQGTAGRLVERFGVMPTLVPAFIFGAAATAGLGYGATSVALAATFTGLLGLFIGLGTGGAIALSATIYPTMIRSTGVGLAMACGRFGQVGAPLITGALLSLGWRVDQIMLVVSTGGVVAAVFIVLFRGWTLRHARIARQLDATLA